MNSAKQKQKQKQKSSYYQSGSRTKKDTPKKQQKSNRSSEVIDSSPFKSVSYQSPRQHIQRSIKHDRPDYMLHLYENSRQLQHDADFQRNDFIHSSLKYFINKYSDGGVAIYNPPNQKDNLIFTVNIGSRIRGQRSGGFVTSLWTFLETEKINKTQRVFAPLTIVEKKKTNKGENIESHFNVMIFDLKKKVLTRFEPHGFSYRDQKVEKCVNTMLESLITSTENSTQKGSSKYIKHYIPPNLICPAGRILQRWENLIWEAIGQYENDEAEEWLESVKYFTKTKGLCVIWSLWYIELSIKNPKKGAEKIIEYMSGNLTKRNEFPYETIRYYLNHLMKQFIYGD